MSKSLSKFIGPRIPKYYHLAFNKEGDIIGYIHKSDIGWKTNMLFHPNKFKLFTQEHKDMIKKNHAKCSGDKNSFYGKTHSVESKLKIAARDYSSISKAIIINGIMYRSSGEAERELNIPRGVIPRLITSGKLHPKYNVTARYE